MDCPVGTRYKSLTRIEKADGSYQEIPGECQVIRPRPILVKKAPRTIVANEQCKPIIVRKACPKPKACPRVTVKKSLKKVSRNPIRSAKVVVNKITRKNPMGFRKRLSRVGKLMGLF